MAVRKMDRTRQRLLEEAAAELRKAVGEEWVSDDPAILIGYSRDQSLEIAHKPQLVVLPDSTEQVSQVIRLANRYRMAVTPWSTGGNTGGGCIPQRGGILLDLRRMDRILELDPENMTVRIQPNVTFGKCYVEAEKHGLRNANPSAPASVSMLANYLDKGVFQVSNRYGVGTDSILGMTVVLADGSVVRTGCDAYPGVGHVCVEGPGPDLGGIFHASMGIFGVVTEMVCQLYPIPRCEDVQSCEFEEEDMERPAAYLRELAREDCAIETILFGDGYLALGVSENQDAAEVLRPSLPRHNCIAFIGGEDQEEVDMRRRQLLRIAERTGATPSAEALHEMLKELLPWRRVFKIIQVTPRIERFSGMFELFWFNIEMDRAGELHRRFTKLARLNFQDTDPDKSELPFPPEEVTFYLQPLEFGRTGMLELDAFPNQAEPEGIKRGLKMASEAIPLILESGGLFDRPYGGVNSGFGWMQTPRLGVYRELLGDFKAALDPGNIMNPGRLALPAE